MLNVHRHHNNNNTNKQALSDQWQSKTTMKTLQSNNMTFSSGNGNGSHKKVTLNPTIIIRSSTLMYKIQPGNILLHF